MNASNGGGAPGQLPNLPQQQQQQQQQANGGVGVAHAPSSNGPLSNGTAAATAPTLSSTSLNQQQPAVMAGPPIAEFLAQLEDYTPSIPDGVTQHFLSTTGFETDDPRIVKLVSLAAQKFVSDIANDALQHSKMRGAGQQASKKSKDRKYTMTAEDLAQALSDQGLTLKKPPYYV